MVQFSCGVLLTFTLIAFTSLVASELLDGYRYCSRPCVSTSTPKRCRYNFFVSELQNVNSICRVGCGNETVREDCTKKPPGNGILGINGASPGPPIEVCLGDTVEVTVTNGLGTAEVSLHWHGVRQSNSAHMDGVPMITQCPIMPFSAFRYEFKPETAGTHLYYAHSVMQQGDGIYGALIVRDPENDAFFERTLLLSAKLRRPLTQLWPDASIPADLLINGKTNGLSLSVDKNQRYLLRVINANAIACSVIIGITGHVFETINFNGEKVRHKWTGSRAVLFPGVRFDLIVETNQSPKRYSIYFDGLGDCRGLSQTATLDYRERTDEIIVGNADESFTFSETQLNMLEKGYDCREAAKDVICSLDANVHELTERASDETAYISFDITSVEELDDHMTDFSYNIYGFTHYPTYLSSMNRPGRVPEINGMTFKYPSSPILSQPENTPDEMLCSVEHKSEYCIKNTPHFCECLQIIEVPVNSTIQIVLIDEGFGGNASHTFHVHGYRVSVVGIGSFEKAVSKADIIALDDKNKLPRNLNKDQKTDTFIVPNKGYVILRFHTDNIGYWLWESRSTATTPTTSGPGMQFLLQVGSRENMPTVPIDFPSCGNNKRPDLIFEDN